MSLNLLDLMQFNIINRMDNGVEPKTSAFTIPSSSNLFQLLKRICEKTERKKEWFDMELENGTLLKIVTKEDEEKVLKDMLFSTDDPNVITLLPTQAYKEAKKENPMLGLQEEVEYHFDSYNFTTKSSTGYVGLANQGATCYLNSLVQTLFMTPEFRSAIYNWSFEEHCKNDFQAKLAEKGLTSDHKSSEEKYKSYKMKVEEKSIPRQLQKLFVRLQLSSKRSCETKDLTKSFGWDSRSDAFTQHDVQEVYRVLFDALETVWKGTDKEYFITDNYQGKIKDYVKCLRCLNESCRMDSYLDVPLVIKGFGETTAVGSVQEAIAKFVEPETLSGDNQYVCSKCECKVDAEKGLKFSSLPYLLTLQLKRFEFDFETLNRVKLNDRVVFPEILDLNRFVVREGGEASTASAIHDENSEDLMFSVSEAAKAKREETLLKALQNGPYVYELYSILVHTGSALGGHYYAYIRSFRKKKWFCFNDSTVSDIRTGEPKEAFGGDGTSAYMLMYRQYNSNKNQMESLDDAIPPSLHDVVNEENKVEEQKEQERERKRQMVKLKLHYKKQIKEIEIHKDETIEDATREAAKVFDLVDYYPENIRLRDYNTIYETRGKPYDGELNLKSLEQLSIHFTKSFVVEVKAATEEFEVYNPDNMTLIVSLFDTVTQCWGEQQLVSIFREATLGELKVLLEKKFGIPVSDQVLVKQEYQSGKVIPMIEEDKILKEVSITHEGVKLMLEPKLLSEHEKEKYPEGIRALHEINRVHNSIEISFGPPGSTTLDYKYKTSKKITVGDLKKYIGEQLHLAPETIKLVLSHSRELSNDSLTLSDYYLAGEVRVSVEKQGINVKFVIFDPNNKENVLERLFTLSLPSRMTIKDAKQEVYDHFQKLQQSEETKRKDNLVLPPPACLRFRSMFMLLPDKIHADEDLLCNTTRINSEIAIQFLPEGVTETKAPGTYFIFLQQFDPATYSLSNKIEIPTTDTQSIAQWREKLIEVTGVTNLAWAAVESWQVKVVTLSELNWFEGTEEKFNGETVRCLGLSEGDLLLYKDKTIPLAELNEEEKKKIQTEESRQEAAQKMSYKRKEEQFKITIQDVALDDV